MFEDASRHLDYPDVSARHFELLRKPGLVVPEAALRRRSINYSGAAPVILTFRDNSQVGGSGGSSGSHTHSLSFGPASSDRALIALATSNSATNTTCTIGGVAATLCVRSIATSTATRTEIWIALVPSGTSGNVVLSGPSGNWTSMAGVYSATGLKSRTPTDTDADEDFNGSTFDSTVSTTVSVQAGGFLVSSAFLGGGAIAASATWTGATQDFFQAPGGSQSGASKNATTTQNVTVTTSFGSGIGKVGATASFR